MSSIRFSITEIYAVIWHLQRAKHSIGHDGLYKPGSTVVDYRLLRDQYERRLQLGYYTMGTLQTPI